MEIIPKSQIPKIIVALVKGIYGQSSHSPELTLIRKDDNELEVEIMMHISRIKGQSLVLGIARDITERKRAEKTQLSLSHDLKERVKELNCIYNISTLVDMHDSIEEILKGTVDLIPSAWHYPEVTCARITFDGREFETENFRETFWKQTCELIVHGKPRGSIQVGFLEERHDEKEPFLQEERALLKTISEGLSHIVERMQAQKTLQLSHDLLQIANRHTQITPLLEEFLAEIKNFSGCTAIGIRLLDREGNIPYTAYGGFPKEFYESESPLSIKSDQCMCINVIEGLTDPALPFYTENGSFYMNGTTSFLATVSEEDKGETRNVCNQYGYESVALIPIHHYNRILGLIHIADSRENMVPLDIVHALEGAATQLGIAIGRIVVEEALKEREKNYRQLADSITDVFFAMDADLRYTYWNKASEDLTGILKKDALGKSLYELFPGERGTKADKAYLEVLRTQQPQTIVNGYQIGGKGYVFELRVYPSSNGLSVFVKDITEQRKLEAERLLHSRAVSDAFSGIAITDMEGNYTYANKSYASMHGYAPEELIGSPVSMMIPEEYLRVYESQIIPGVLKGGWSGETVGKRQDGTTFDIRVSSSLIKDNEGNPIAILGISEDITEHKRAEKALQESRERFQALTESTSDWVWEVDVDNVYTYVSPKVKDLLGYEPVEIIGKTPFDLMPPEEAKSVAEKFRAIVDSLSPFERLENTNMHKDGRLVVLETSGVPIFDSNGCFCGYRGIDRDMTERKKAERELILKDNAIGSSINAVAITDLEGKLTYVNIAFLEMWGYEAEDQVLERHATEFWLSDEQTAKVIKILREEGEWFGELVGQRKDGTHFHAQVAASMVTDKEGKAYSMMASFVDISNRKRAEEQLKESLKEKDKLLNEIHHRVKNNLQVISSLVDMGKIDILDQKTVNLLDGIQSKIYSIALIHEQLYKSDNFNQIEMEGHIRDLVSYLTILYMGKKEITTVVKATEIYLSINQAVPFTLALTELITNAFKHAFNEGQKGTIVISMHRSAKGTILTRVKDNGIGIGGEVDIYNTNSLGLELVRTLVQEQLHGKIQVECNKGTEFTIEFQIPD